MRSDYELKRCGVGEEQSSSTCSSGSASRAAVGCVRRGSLGIGMGQRRELCRGWRDAAGRGRERHTGRRRVRTDRAVEEAHVTARFGTNDTGSGHEVRRQCRGARIGVNPGGEAAAMEQPRLEKNRRGCPQEKQRRGERAWVAALRWWQRPEDGLRAAVSSYGFWGERTLTLILCWNEPLILF